MSYDTSTMEGLRKERMRRVTEVEKSDAPIMTKVRRINRLIGCGAEDMADYIPGADDGEPPQGAKW